MRTIVVLLSCLALSIVIALGIVFHERSSLHPVLGINDKKSLVKTYNNSMYHFRFRYPEAYKLSEKENIILISEDPSSSSSARVQLLIEGGLDSSNKDLQKKAQEICANGQVGVCSQVESQSVVTNIHGVMGTIYYFKRHSLNDFKDKGLPQENRGPFYVYQIDTDNGSIGLIAFGTSEDKNNLLSFIADGLELYHAASLSPLVSLSPSQLDNLNASQSSLSAK